MAAVNSEAWRTLYQRAMRIKELAPWTWMAEDELFGIEDPESKTPAYVSISGALGEHVAVIAYLGDVALHRFLHVQASEGEARAETILEIRQIQASFEDREYLKAEDHRIIRELDLKFRGSQAWPCFRSTHPGCVPWFLDGDEVRMMTHVLEQTEMVVIRAKGNRALLPSLADGGPLLVRRAETAKAGLSWVEEMRSLPPAPTLPITTRVSEDMIRRALRHPRAKDAVELDLVMMLDASVHEKNQRPYFPYALMLVDGGSGVVLAFDLLSPLPSLEEMWGAVVPALLSRLDGIGFIPSTIRVRTDIMEFLMKKLAEFLPVKVNRTKTLPKLDVAMRELQAYMGHGRPGGR
ncbi:MAG: hypothetical protein MUE60_06155 [Candidatus Eisenbacteria bacterium]|jgi:hypothetical protein|nr:hypothetical protein [Candidatus Eisenbacteria bacterium]